eukprot:SAG31_NODE_15486_length_752_cov_1.891271_1_plen_59_part_01
MGGGAAGGPRHLNLNLVLLGRVLEIAGTESVLVPVLWKHYRPRSTTPPPHLSGTFGGPL